MAQATARANALAGPAVACNLPLTFNSRCT